MSGQMDSGQSPFAQRLFDGEVWHKNAGLWCEAGRVAEVIPAPQGHTPDHVLLVPGFVDLQVNGGGGVQFNDAPETAALPLIIEAHRAGGTTSLMVTLITDAPEVTADALAACADAVGLEGLVGLHLEGPHLDPRRKGTHDARFIRPMEESDLVRILEGAAACGHVIVTLAPEAAAPEQIARLVAAGVQVSLGHSDCRAEEAHAAFAAGADMVTHLFNAMSPLGHRAPGLVGAALDSGVSCGLIADGHHVSDSTMRVALCAKAGRAKAGRAKTGRIFLVSDAMATIGTTLSEIALNGRTIHRANGRLTLCDGTLAGADITLLDAVRYVHRHLEVPLEEALRMAALYPADAAGLARKGHLRPGADADFLLLDADLSLISLFVSGTQRWAA